MFLIDTGADISILKGAKLIGTTEYDPDRKVTVKCVDGSPMETHGVLEARIELQNRSTMHNFQLVNNPRKKWKDKLHKEYDTSIKLHEHVEDDKGKGLENIK